MTVSPLSTSLWDFKFCFSTQSLDTVQSVWILMQKVAYYPTLSYFPIVQGQVDANENEHVSKLVYYHSNCHPGRLSIFRLRSSKCHLLNDPQQGWQNVQSIHRVYPHPCPSVVQHRCLIFQVQVQDQPGIIVNLPSTGKIGTMIIIHKSD